MWALGSASSSVTGNVVPFDLERFFYSISAPIMTGYIRDSRGKAKSKFVD